MRPASKILQVLLLCAGILPMRAAEDKMPEARGNVLPGYLVKALKLADEATLYSLDPVAVGDRKIEGEKLANWAVIGKVRITEGALTRTAIDLFTEAVKHGDGEVGLCFEPRHALRVKDGGKTYDFIMCYKCHLAAVYKGDERIAVVQMKGSPAWYNELLQAAGIRVAD